MNTRLVIVSDSHNKHNELILPQGTILIHCGDGTYHGEVAETINWLVWLQLQTHKYQAVLSIFGNHEIYVSQNVDEFRELRSIYAPDVKWLTMNSWKDPVSGLKFYGCPYVNFINGHWVWEATESEMEELVKKIPNDIDVLISHGPPYGILDNFYRKRAIDDLTARFGIRFEEIELKVGSKALLKRIQEIRPSVVCFGHIHENGNTKLEIDGITYINAAILDEHYEIAHEPMVIDV